MERKSYIKEGTDFIYEGKEYTFEKENDVYTLYYFNDDFYYPMMSITEDDLDGEGVEEYFKNELY